MDKIPVIAESFYKDLHASKKDPDVRTQENRQQNSEELPDIETEN